MGDCPTSGFTHCGHSMAGGTLYPARAVGAVMGDSGLDAAGDTAPRASAGIDWSGHGSRSALGRLGAPAVRLDALRRHCCGGWLLSPALHHAALGTRADVGVNPDAHRSWPDASGLGSIAFGAAAGDHLRVQGEAGSG